MEMSRFKAPFFPHLPSPERLSEISASSAEKLKLRLGVLENTCTLNWSLTWDSVLPLSSEIPPLDGKR